MQLPIIKQLVNDFDMKSLQSAEEAILDERIPSILVGGVDEGEQLTHVMAAIWIKNEMEKNGLPLHKAVRNYSVKVRTSIS